MKMFRSIKVSLAAIASELAAIAALLETIAKELHTINEPPVANTEDDSKQEEEVVETTLFPENTIQESKITRQRWTKDEEAIAVKMHELGASIPEISNCLRGRSKDAIYGKLYKLGVLK